MGLEIERRFLVVNDGWRQFLQYSEPLQQGYLSEGSSGFTIRVRCSTQKAWLTIKARTADPVIRHEFELAMPHAEALQLLDLTPCRIKKTRHHLLLPGGDWVIDVFEAENAGLIIAEVELPKADSPIEIPAWCGAEISDRGELSNAALAVKPWKFRQLEAKM